MRKWQFLIGLVGFCVVCLFAIVFHLRNESFRLEELAKSRCEQLRLCRTKGEVRELMHDFPTNASHTTGGSALGWRIGDYNLFVEFGSGDDDDAVMKGMAISYFP